MFGGVGYCGLDRRRERLAGDEIRACWSPPIALVAGSASVEIQAPTGEHAFAPGTRIAADADPLSADHPSTFWVELDA